MTQEKVWKDGDGQVWVQVTPYLAVSGYWYPGRVGMPEDRFELGGLNLTGGIAGLTFPASIYDLEKYVAYAIRQWLNEQNDEIQASIKETE
jgi:hypothetical protein